MILKNYSIAKLETKTPKKINLVLKSPNYFQKHDLFSTYFISRVIVMPLHRKLTF